MPKRVCATCGTPFTVTYARQRRCPAHHDGDDPRPNSTQRGYDRKWARTRGRYIALHPSCERCAAPTVDVHHLDGLGPNGPNGHKHHNLQALCHSCHSRITATGGRT